MFRVLAFLLFAALGATGVHAQDAEPRADEAAPPAGAMTGAALTEIVRRIDPEAEALGNGVAFELVGREVVMVYDEAAGRMRAMSPITPAATLDADLMERMLQANYDSALDARYALAQGIVWSVFISPLGSLTRDDFLSGLAQTVTAAETFGADFTSGAIVFGGGDSQAINEALLEALRRADEDAI